MTPEEIGRLVDAARRAGLRELEVSGPDVSLRIRMETAAGDPEGSPALGVAPRPVPAGASTPRGARAPGVGLFRHRHPLTGRPSSEPGQRVEMGQVVGFVDTGTCLRPVTAPEAGAIGAPALADGTLVGYGTLLYRLA